MLKCLHRTKTNAAATSPSPLPPLLLLLLILLLLLLLLLLLFSFFAFFFFFPSPVILDFSASPLMLNALCSRRDSLPLHMLSSTAGCAELVTETLYC